MKNLKRRDFLKNSFFSGIGATLFPYEVLSAEQHNLFSERSTKGTKKIIIAGGGISGLCCGYELMKKGHEVVILEANGRHGGHVYTGRDGLSENLYTDYGADHITIPGYEKFFEYLDEFELEAIPYPHAEGSAAAPNRNGLKMIDGKFYSDKMLSDPTILANLGFNEKEIQFLSRNPWYALSSFYTEKYLKNFTDPWQPFGVGYDDYDNIPISQIYRKEGASETALRFLGGDNTSALFELWRSYVEKSRGIPLSQGDTYRVKGGNQELPNAFAKRLGKRLKLNHRIKSIQHSSEGVSVTYTAYGYDEEKTMEADFLVNAICLPVFRNIPIKPSLSPEKQYVVDNLQFSSHPFYVFEASSRFWLEDGFDSINMEFESPDISMIWEEPTHHKTDNVLLKAYGPGGLSPERVLATFRELYPGKKDTIFQALTHDWTKNKFAPSCEMHSFPIGEFQKFWPQILLPEDRIYFAGTYADNLSRGMESCIRSGQRIANEINNI